MKKLVKTLVGLSLAAVMTFGTFTAAYALSLIHILIVFMPMTMPIEKTMAKEYLCQGITDTITAVMRPYLQPFTKTYVKWIKISI